MPYETYKLLNIRIDRGVAFVTINNPPMNLLTIELATELYTFSLKIAADSQVKVIVFDSADPDFFIAHVDVNLLALLPDTPLPKPAELHPLKKAHENFRRMPKVTIAKIEGRARGGGSEFCLALDMRFGAIGKALLCQPEAALGIIPGGGGSQRLPRLVGTSKAMEIIFSCDDYPAELAEKYGYINRALPADELTPFVEKLAFRIASYQPEVIAATKNAIYSTADMPLAEGLLEETYVMGQLAALPETKRRMKKFFELGGQTREGEMDTTWMIEKLSED